MKQQRALVLVCAVLLGGIVAVALGIATRPAVADDPPAFWREEQLRKFAAPSRVASRSLGRARLMKRKPVEAPAEPVTRTAGRVRMVGPVGHRSAAFVERQAIIMPSDVDADSFARRALVPPPLKRQYMPLLLPLIEPSVLPPAPLPERNGPARTRALCLAAVLGVAITAGFISHLTTQRGMVHA